MKALDPVADKETTEWEATTVVEAGYTIADFRKAFDKVCNKDDWKSPFVAEIDEKDWDVTWRAVCYFFGEVPKSKPSPVKGKLLIASNGYQAW